ncbi:MAG: hypothetical protein HY318_11790 [Armatimonadetes bacterium]|nr:hypothetical protein [Armatimonadota bacterium]
MDDTKHKNGESKVGSYRLLRAPLICMAVFLLCVIALNPTTIIPTGPWVNNLEARLPGGGSVRYCNRIFRNHTQEAVFWTHPSGKVDRFLIQEHHGPSAQITIRLSADGRGVWFTRNEVVIASLDLRTGQFIDEGGSLDGQWGSGVETWPEWVNSKRSRVLARKRFRN